MRKKLLVDLIILYFKIRYNKEWQLYYWYYLDHNIENTYDKNRYYYPNIYKAILWFQNTDGEMWGQDVWYENNNIKSLCQYLKWEKQYA